jgi:hypothetical protein
MSLTSSGRVRSAWMNAEAPSLRLISSTSCRPSRPRRPVMTTFAPNSATRLAVAAPIPRVPPVTSATLPANFRSGGSKFCFTNSFLGMSVIDSLWAVHGSLLRIWQGTTSSVLMTITMLRRSGMREYLACSNLIAPLWLRFRRFVHRRIPAGRLAPHATQTSTTGC